MSTPILADHTFDGLCATCLEHSYKLKALAFPKVTFHCPTCLDELRAAVSGNSSYYETLRAKDKWIAELLADQKESDEGLL